MSRKITSPNLELYLIRHAATEWSQNGRHTGSTDLPLTELGLKQARVLSSRLKNESFAKVFCSPLQRATETCRISGLTPIIDKDLCEWNYGKYEGLTSLEIEKQNPGWDLFKDGAPGGESVAQIAERARRFLTKVQTLKGKIAIFSSAHFLRIFTTEWIGVPPIFGKALYLSAASISILGFEHQEHVIILWNDIAHLSIS